jgi:hypothetical protein
MRLQARASLVLFLLCASLLTSPCIAGESPTCDEGDIKGVSLLVGGKWCRRPDARIDGQPRSLSLGPFPVRAVLEPGSRIVRVDLCYSYDHANSGIVPTTIVAGEIRGEIPRREAASALDTRVLFFLDGFDSEGHLVWEDELPYACPPEEYAHGDPYRILIAAAAGIQIDINPGSDPNAVNVHGLGLIPVALIGRANFDVGTVQSGSIAFGPNRAAPVRDGRVRDVNGDGYPDLVVYFRTPETGIGSSTSEACLTVQTIDGTTFEGCDTIMAVDGQHPRRARLMERPLQTAKIGNGRRPACT